MIVITSSRPIVESELNILLNVPREDLIKISNETIADAIIQVREGKVHIKPGYDGVYGIPIFENSQNKSKTNSVEEENIKENKQQDLNKFF